jgi:hypothetical protein
MAQTQVKPVAGGSWTNVTAKGKDTTGISNLPSPLMHQVTMAAQLYSFVGGSAGTKATYAGKLAAAAGRQLQWA